MFHVVAVQAYFTKKEFTIDPKWGLLGKYYSDYAQFQEKLIKELL